MKLIDKILLPFRCIALLFYIIYMYIWFYFTSTKKEWEEFQDNF